MDDEQEEELVSNNAKTFMLEQIKGQDTQVQEELPEVIVAIPMDPDSFETIVIPCILDLCFTGMIIKTSLAMSLLKSGRYVMAN